MERKRDSQGRFVREGFYIRPAPPKGLPKLEGGATWKVGKTKGQAAREKMAPKRIIKNKFTLA